MLNDFMSSEELGTMPESDIQDDSCDLTEVPEDTAISSPSAGEVKLTDRSPVSVTCMEQTNELSTNDSVERMLANLIIHEEAHFRHQTRDEEPLSDDQKLTIARDLYSRKPGVFLERFSRYLDWPQDRINFTKWHRSDNLVGYFMDKLDRESKIDEMHKSKSAACRVRNRRLNALYRVACGETNSLVADHFTHEAMRQRDPVLWEAMIGQHLDEPTRRRYLDREYCTFAGYLHGQLMQQEEKQMLIRARQAQRTSASEQEDGNVDYVDAVSDLVEDREQEFLDMMKLRFVSGQDTGFDYAKVDKDETLDDDDDQLALDEEEKYFDAD